MSKAQPPTTVLIIDDDPGIREELRDTLQAWGYTVVEAANGKEGVRQVQKVVPDLVITDIMMPEMDGIEVIRTIRQTHPTLRIIALSGGDSQGYMGYLSAAGKLGADDVIAKPVPLAKLRAAIMAATGAKGSA